MSSSACPSRREGAVVLLGPAAPADGSRRTGAAAFETACVAALADEDCRAIVLELEGDPGFGLHDAEPSAVVEHARRVQALCESLRRGGKPVVGVLRGEQEGAGFDLALSCHVVVAEEGAVLRAGGVARGRLDGFGGIARLQRRVGAGRAAWLSLASQTLRAGDLAALGLVELVVPPGEGVDAALAFAQACAGRDRSVIEALLEQLAVGADLPFDDALELEAQLAGLAVARGRRS
jgi:enoyl-CoA hydratase